MVKALVTGAILFAGIGAAAGANISFSDLVSDPTKFGTNVFLDTGPAAYGTLGLSQTPLFQDGVRVSDQVIADPSGTRHGNASLLITSFTLGAQAIDNVSGGTLPRAAAVASTGITSGPTAPVAGSVSITGSFAGTADLGGLSMQFFLQDYLCVSDPSSCQNPADPLDAGRDTYVSLFIQTQSTQGGTRAPLFGRAVSCFGNESCEYDVAFDATYGSFATTIPFTILASPGNGLIAELYVSAFSQTGEAQQVDFLGTAGITLAPAAGQTVTLSSGQTFSGIDPGTGRVPEPGTMLLLGAAMAAMGVMCRRAQRRKQVMSPTTT